MGKIQFQAKKGGDFKLPPEGTYDFEIIDWKEEKADDEGNFRLYLQLKVADGDHAGSEVRDYHTLSAERGFTFRNVLMATGVDYNEEGGGEDGSPYSIECDPDELIGRYFQADLTHYKNERTKKTYPNFNEVRVSPFQQAANGESAEESAADEPATEAAPPKAATPPKAPQGTARPRPRA